MHPFQQSNELCFKNISSSSSDPYQENTIPHQDLIHLASGDQSSPILPSGQGHHDPSTKRTGKRSNIDEINNSTTGSKKKMMHREIERQRRQEMAARNASLRSLIPQEYIKGKRSISDHMNEAVNYIKHLKNNIGVLGAKRDELIKNRRRDRGDLVPGRDDEGSSICFPCRVMVGPMVADGIEILMSSGSVREQDFPLSRVIEIVLGEGLDVVNCCSTKVNDRLLQTIQAQVSGICNIDSSGLQEKLTQAVSQSSGNVSDL